MLSAGLSHQITLRHFILGNVSGLEHPLQVNMFNALNDGRGIYVHWGAYESGKSRAAKNTALRLQNAGKLAILLHGYDYSYKSTMREWLYQAIGIAKTEESISKHFNKPTCVIIDHFDGMLRKQEDSIEALKTLDTNVMLVVSSWENALDLEKKGCKLIGHAGCGRWSLEQLNALYASLPPSIQEKWTGSKKDELLRLSELAGTPGYLSFSVYDKPNAKKAELIDAEWHNGIRALEGESVEEKGRFPDKEGVFHWN